MYAARAYLHRFSRCAPHAMRPMHVRRALATAASRTPFVLADIGEGIAEVEVMQWHVKKGDAVKQFQPLVEVQSDKATVEITSRYDGVVDELRYKEGDIAKVGLPLCFILAEQDEAKTQAKLAPSETQAAEVQALGTTRAAAPDVQPSDAASDAGADATAVRKPLAPPAVRRIAKERGIPLAAVRGSGPGGRITKDDVLRHAQAVEAEEAAAASEALAEAPPPAGVRVEAVRGLRRAMARSMAAATAVPHLGLCEEVRVDKLLALHRELKSSPSPAADAERRPRISLMPFFIKAASLALAQFPVLNASVDADCEHVRYHEAHNISVAMDCPAGLAVPNVKRVQERTLADIAAEMARLRDCARTARFERADLVGGTFALSNVGTIGGTYAAPVVMLPQVAIGALGRIRVVPRFAPDGSVVAASVLSVSWAADHRVVDGATMARFSNAWKEFIEHPERMLIHLK